MRKRIVIAAKVWTVLLVALSVLFIGYVVLSDECSGTHSICGDWTDTCCTRGCSVTSWYPVQEFVSCHTAQINVGLLTYSGACVKYKDTAYNYTCPTQDPPCTKTYWWFYPMEEC